MTKYRELEQQAAELLKQAEAIRTQERDHIIGQIKDMVLDWNISASELGFKIGKSSDKRKMNIKFRHPITGMSWSGQGRTPKWLAEEISAGATKEQFAVA